MGHKKRGLRIAATCLAGMALMPGGASAATIVNGDFETGDFTGWQATDRAGSAGHWHVYSGTTAPQSSRAVPAPPRGSHAAVTDQTNPSVHYLSQDVALEPDHDHELSFVLFYNNDHSSWVVPDPASLTTTPNQQYRVDVLEPSAAVDSLAADDVLATAFATRPGDALTLAPTVKTLDLSAFAGRTVRLRFAVAVDRTYLRGGVDDVRIVSTRRDVTAPVTTTAAGPEQGGITDDTTPTFEFQADEPGTSFECSVDDAAPTACASPFTTPELALGEHTVAITATDAAGNRAEPLRRTFVVAVPPVAPAATAPAAAPPACASRRRFTIRLRPAGRRLRSAVVRVNGKRVKVSRRRGRLTAVIDLRGRPEGTATVRIEARDAKGRRHREVRRYETC